MFSQKSKRNQFKHFLRFLCSTLGRKCKSLHYVFFGNRVYRSTQSWLSKIFSHIHLIIYLCSNEVVVRVGLFQHGQQTLWCWDRLLEMRTLPDLKPLQDDLGPVQLFSKRLELLQRTAEREHVDILLKGVWWWCCAKTWPGVVGGEEGGAQRWIHSPGGAQLHLSH